MKTISSCCIAALIMFTAALALADTDYVCLKACIGNGESHTACMPKCSYGASSSAAQPHMEASCLKACLRDGGEAVACVPQCTSTPPLTQSSANGSHADKPVHNLFKAPQQVDGIILPPPQRVAPVSLDYGCMNICTKAGLRYQLCSERCARQ